MATKSRAVTVTDEPTRLDTVDETDSVSSSSCLPYNADAAVTVYLGGDDVTTANGVPVPPESFGPSFTLDDPREAVYAIVASGTAEVRVIEQGV